LKHAQDLRHCGRRLYTHQNLQQKHKYHFQEISGLKLSSPSRDAFINIWCGVQIVKLLITQLFAVPNHSFSSVQNISLCTVSPIAYDLACPWCDRPIYTSDWVI